MSREKFNGFVMEEPITIVSGQEDEFTMDLEIDPDEIVDDVEEEEEEEEIEDEETQDDPLLDFAQYLAEEELIELSGDDEFKGIETIKEKLDEALDKRIEEYKSTLPSIVKDLTDYIDNGGDPKTFLESYANSNDYSNLDPETDAKRIVRDYYRILEGESDDVIESAIEEYEDSGILERRAGRYLQKLVKHQQNQQAQLIKEQELARQRQVEAYEKWVSEVADFIDKTEDIAGIPIQKKEKKPFIDYFNKPLNKKGQTQYMIDLEKDRVSNSVKLAYLMYKNFDFKDIQTKAESKAAIKLKEKLKQGGQKSTIKIPKLY